MSSQSSLTTKAPAQGDNYLCSTAYQGNMMGQSTSFLVILCLCGLVDMPCLLHLSTCKSSRFIMRLANLTKSCELEDGQGQLGWFLPQMDQAARQ